MVRGGSIVPSRRLHQWRQNRCVKKSPPFSSDRYGQARLKVEIQTNDGGTLTREVPSNTAQSAQQVAELIGE
jgi:hypothetical protein